MSDLGAYHHDIFYEINRLPLDRVMELLREARSVCTNWRADILDCKVSWSRQVIPDCTFETAMDRCTRNAHYVFIHRRGYEGWKEPNEILEGWRLEVGYRAMTEPDYFLWINCKEEYIDGLAEKYGIKPLGDG